jgi:hypothetical protein
MSKLASTTEVCGSSSVELLILQLARRTPNPSLERTPPRRDFLFGIAQRRRSARSR